MTEEDYLNDVIHSYAVVLARKISNGKLSSEKYDKYCDKLAEWYANYDEEAD